MDRNSPSSAAVIASFTVALRKESVDRNITGNDLCGLIVKSLSARRAWIEMPTLPVRRHGLYVALRKESVDRNWNLVDQAPEHRGSLSARRAWIEMLDRPYYNTRPRSLSARRAWIEMTGSGGCCRQCG